MSAPVVGQQVCFVYKEGDEIHKRTAHVARVFSETCVNLSVLSAEGNWYGKTSVTKVDQDMDKTLDERLGGCPFGWTWMGELL